MRSLSNLDQEIGKDKRQPEPYGQGPRGSPQSGISELGWRIAGADESTLHATRGHVMATQSCPKISEVAGRRVRSVTIQQHLSLQGSLTLEQVLAATPEELHNSHCNDHFGRPFAGVKSSQYWKDPQGPDNGPRCLRSRIPSAGTRVTGRTTSFCRRQVEG
jgi:hypothetical protein